MRELGFPPAMPNAAPDRSHRVAGHLLGLTLLLATLVALPVAPSDLDRHQFPKETLVLLGTFLTLVIVEPRIGRSVRAVAWPALGLVAWSMLSSLAATNPWLATRATALTVVGASVLLVGTNLRWERGGRAALGWLTAAMAVGALTGLAQALGYEHPWFARLRAPGGSFGNRNFLAHAAALALPLGLAWSLLGRRRGTRLAALAVVTLLAMMLVMTRSRAGWLAAAGGSAAMALLLARARGTLGGIVSAGRGVGVAAALAAGVALALVVPTTLEWRSASPYRDTLGNLANFAEGSGRGRLLQFSNTLALARRHPLLGVGPGNWPLHYGEVAPADDPSWIRSEAVPLNPWPSSDAMAMLSERGLPGAALAGMLALALLWTAWRAAGRGGETAVWGAVLAGLVTAVGIAGLFDAVLLLAVPTLAASMAGGVLVRRTAPDAPAPGPARVRQVVLLALLGVGLARSALQTTAYLVAGTGGDRAALERAVKIDPHSYQLRIRLARRGPCRTARPHAEAALRLAPSWPAARAAARRCGVPQLSARPHSDQLPS